MTALFFCRSAYSFGERGQSANHPSGFGTSLLGRICYLSDVFLNAEKAQDFKVDLAIIAGTQPNMI